MNQIPSFHEGLLVGVEILAEKNVILRVEDVEGRRFIVRLHGVKYMTINDFREGNIILDVYLTERLEDERAIIARLALGTDDTNDSRVSHYIEEALKQNYKLLIIAPSCGADVVALCRDVELCDDDVAPQAASKVL